MINTKQKIGHVTLIGAGPGDPGLLTLNALNALQSADVIFFDALANPILLEYAKPNAQIIDVGKRANQHKLTQDQTNQLLVDKTLEGNHVVRLKGGDPYLFGRGAEEAIFLSQHNIHVEIIPGITAGIAAPAYAGIPVTYRKIASSVTFVTGHEDPTKPETALDYNALASLITKGNTVCFYMGVKNLPNIVNHLTQNGAPTDTPVALIQWGTRTKQKSITTNLTDAVNDVTQAGIASPAIILVGKVAAIDNPALQSFTNRPLFGKTFLVTRTRQQASQLTTQLTDLGAHVIQAPTIALKAPNTWDHIDTAIKNLSAYPWLILTSTNAVDTLADRLEKLNLDARALAQTKIAVIGQATADHLKAKLSITADLIPTRQVSEILAQELLQQDIANTTILILQADIARPTLVNLLEEGGATVDQVTAYHTTLVDSLPQEAIDAIQEGTLDCITFTSASTANNLATLLADLAPNVANTIIASIGPITTTAIKQNNWTPTIESTEANINALVQTILTHYTQTPATAQ